MTRPRSKMLALDTSQPIWSHFFTIAPLVVVGSAEGEGFDLAPKHMATPLGYDNFFGFVCTPRHTTYHNVRREGAFTVSFPKPGQVIATALAASPRDGVEPGDKPILQQLPTVEAPGMKGVFLADSYLALECEHLRTVDGFGENSLICGKITGAYLDPEYKRLSEADEQGMLAAAPLLAYLAYGRFAEVRSSFSFPFPKNFKM